MQLLELNLSGFRVGTLDVCGIRAWLDLSPCPVRRTRSRFWGHRLGVRRLAVLPGSCVGLHGKERRPTGHPWKFNESPLIEEVLLDP